ncbi:MAG: PLP-dependent transferase, partial [Acetobacterium sp.]|nr:PLP-dependent transferase [Acetobacterium sp.]
IAEALKNYAGVKAIYYPGLPDSQGYEINQKQADGPGGMLSFELDEKYNIKTFFESLELITLAESLGGVESLICHPSSMTHASIPYEIRQKVGIVENLIRISVGIEDKNDILSDLEQAFLKSFEG